MNTLKTIKKFGIKNREQFKYGKNLMFIFSQPRAGSTLLQRILGAHSDIHTTAEPWILLHPLYATKKNGIQTEFGFELSRLGLEDFCNQHPLKEDLYFEAIREMASTLYAGITNITEKTLFLDKTPRYYRIIPEIYHLFPDAKFIFLFRNPLAVYSSIIKSWLNNSPDRLMASGYRHDVLIGPHQLVNSYDLIKEHAYRIQYEDLVTNPTYEVEALCEYLSVPFDKEIIKYGKVKRPEGRMGDDTEIDKHDSPVQTSIDKWVSNLSQSELLFKYTIEYLSTIGKEVVQLMGYSYTSILEKLIANKKTIPLGNAPEDIKYDFCKIFIENVTRLIETHEKELALNYYQSQRIEFGYIPELLKFDLFFKKLDFSLQKSA